MQGYLKAWRSNTPEDIRALFTEDAEYYTQAFREPWRGIEAIIEGWIGRDNVVGNWDFSYEWLAVGEESAVLEGLTVYKEPPESYANVWLIRLNAEGRCVVFKEWWIRK